MGCAASYDFASREVCKEQEIPMEMPVGSWTPIVCMDFSADASTTAYLQALSILALLPGNGQRVLHCTRKLHGMCFGGASEEVVEMADVPFNGCLALSKKYTELRRTVPAGSQERSFAAVLKRACVVAEDERSSRDTDRHAIIILTHGPLAAPAFDKTLQAIRDADDLGVAVICIGLGDNSFGAFLEETLPELCPNFRFHSFASLSGSAQVNPQEARSHSARLICKNVVEALRRPTEEGKKLAQKVAAKKRSKKFCGCCGRLCSCTAASVCGDCSAKTEAKDGCSTPETIEGASVAEASCSSYTSEDSDNLDLASI